VFHSVLQASSELCAVRRKLNLSVIVSKPWMQMQFGVYIFYWDCLVVFLSFVIFISRRKNRTAINWLTKKYIHCQFGYLGKCHVFHTDFQLMSKGSYILF